jgi:hypothetical protein
MMEGEDQQNEEEDDHEPRMREVTMMKQSVRSTQTGRDLITAATEIRLKAIQGPQNNTTEDSRGRADSSVSKIMVNLEIQATTRSRLKRILKFLVIVCRLFILLSPSFTTEAGSGSAQTWIYDVNMICSIVVFIKIALVLRKKSTRSCLTQGGFTSGESVRALTSWLLAEYLYPLPSSTSTLSSTKMNRTLSSTTFGSLAVSSMSYPSSII